MNDLILIMGSSRPNLMQPEYEKQLRKAGIDYHVNQLINIPNNDQGSLGSQLEAMKKMLDLFHNYKKMVLSDAWDVLFYGTGEEVYNKIPDGSAGFIHAAERNLYPEANLASQFSGNTPWRYVNGGLMAGTVEGLNYWIESLEKHPLFDPNPVNQLWLNRRAAEKDSVVNLDTEAKLFYCMYNEHLGRELQLKDNRPWNSLTNVFPNFIHFNGRAPDSDFRAMMGDLI